MLFTTSSALYAHELLKEMEAYKVALVPTPREFSSDCGMAVYIEGESIEAAMYCLDEHRIEYEFNDAK
ncbi:DUF3343 domain-containing protein [Sulfurospirillum barnesii]|uniref:DUF3343 domain-containing protein n=1 Tax=Sulfurospirillum barnesii TaxID=44674 RepID=UPI0002DEE18B|nr:DUF3343 domain-containing protein [Sulfurospirillum barnesii]